MVAKLAILTKEQAKAMWCPFARVPGKLTTAGGEVVWTGAQNRGHAMGGGLPNCMCLGPDCMAWRWHETHIDGRDADGAPELVKNGETYGYCGLAGSPA